MVVDKLKNLLKNESDSLGLPEALLVVIGAIFLYILDLTTKWNGYRIENIPGNVYLTAAKLVFFSYFLIKLIQLVIEKRSKGVHWSEYITEGLLYFIWLVIAGVGLTNPTSSLHLFFSILVYYVYGKVFNPEEKEEFTRVILVLTFMDFFGYAMMKAALPLQETQFNRIILPLWLFYSIGFAMKHNSSKFFGWMFFLMSFLYLATMLNGISLIAQQTDNLDQGVINQAISSLGGGITFLFQDIPKSIGESWHSFYQQTFNQSYIYGGQPEETKNPQGVFLTEIDKGDYTNYNGTPVYLWARFEARTLDKPIDPVKVKCSAEDKDGNVTEGIVNEESTEYNFLVISGVDRTISCRFDDLGVGRYKAIFNATFDFATEATRKIYLINRERYMEELQALNQKGQQATGKDVLRQLKITDISPETIYTSGPVAIGIATDNVPWDIGNEGNIKHRFGITAKNEWKNGGEILKINKMEMIVPSTFDLITSSCDVKLQSAGVKDGDKVYSTTKVIDDIDEFKTINCLMNVNKQSLDPVPVTTRFLKAHVDYTYMITEEIDFKVEALPGATI